MRTVVPLIWLASLTASSAGFAGPEPSESTALVAWVKESAHVIDTVTPGADRGDLDALRKLVGDARVVCLGESRHDAHEQFQFKHRLIEFLATDMGFTLFAMEESFPGSVRINEYVLGADYDPETVLNEMGSWYIWDTEEILALVRWMRARNDAHPDNKMRFFGVDMTDARPAVDYVSAYLRAVDSPYGGGDQAWRRAAEAVFSGDMWPETMENYRRLPAADVDALGDQLGALSIHFDENRTEFVALSTEKEFEVARRHVEILNRAHELFATGVRGTFAEAGAVRERAMVDNIQWILNRNEGERLIVWAHNLHVAKAPLDIDIPDRPPTRGLIPMGGLLARGLGPGLVLSIGFSFNSGRYPDTRIPALDQDSIDGTLALAGIPRFVIDLHDAPREGPVPEWLARAQKMRAQGGYATLVPSDAFDAVFFVDEITPTVPTAGARRRMESLGMSGR